MGTTRLSKLEDLLELGCTLTLTGPDGEDLGNYADLTYNELDQIAMELDPNVHFSEDGRSITYTNGNGNATPKPAFDANAWAKKVIGIK